MTQDLLGGWFAHTSRPALLDAIDDGEPPERYRAAQILQRTLQKGDRLTRHDLRDAMVAVTGSSDAEGGWSWMDALDAAEVAQILLLKERDEWPDSTDGIAELEDLEALQPPSRLRSEDTNRLQQFSTPLPLAALVATAAALRASDTVLEPSAGHGALATFAEHAGCDLILNEMDPERAETLAHMFDATVHTHDASQINDRLLCTARPTVVLMNPPFASSARRGRNPMEAAEHLLSALARLQPNGRLVAIMPPGCSRNTERYARFWDAIDRTTTLHANILLPAGAFTTKGTSVATRLVVMDKDPVRGAPRNVETVENTLSTIHAIVSSLPPRLSIAKKADSPRTPEAPDDTSDEESKDDAGRDGPAPTRPTRAHKAPIRLTAFRGEAVGYTSRDIRPTPKPGEIYVPYETRRIAITNARAHPTKLVESTALALINPPLPNATPMLPPHILEKGLLSDAQLETVVYAAEAHKHHLAGAYRYDPLTKGLVEATDDTGGREYRQGYFIGDGTGAGKGRQVAGILMDNWCHGRRRHVWVSKTQDLLEDAIRDWTALGGRPCDVTAQADIPYGADIRLQDGILFTTFATLRGQSRDGRKNRLEQLIDWLGDQFDGVIAFDEGHAMQNAIHLEGEDGRAVRTKSLQAQVGIDLQYRLPDARILYVSATGASAVANLAYADRLGLWRGKDAPFLNANDFVTKMQQGGVAAMEMLCRDLKALGLYCARNLSFEGVEQEMLIHELGPEQRLIFDTYADAFQTIHQNLERVLEEINIVGADGNSLNGQALGAARSAFEGTKQRFFRSLLTSLCMPSVIQDIEAELEAGHAAVLQIVSTGEAVMTRRIAKLTEEDLKYGDVDVTPRDTVIDYLESAFPTQLFETYRDAEGQKRSELATGPDGEAVISRAAVETRMELVELIGAMPPINCALDQLIWHFGDTRVAEVTGRSKRIVPERHGLREGLRIQSRPASANTAETDAFMDGRKDILVFSEAGGTGRSYHADCTRKNQKRRVHYLLDAGWRADVAIQGLGRTNRSNQASAPIFKPVASNVKGERRFLSTIARRLDALGALTRGERKTGGQGLFKAEDDMESEQAEAALTVFFKRLANAEIDGLGLHEFCDLTGLTIEHTGGFLKGNLPSIRQFLNRLLALRIDVQDEMFGIFEELIANQVELAREAGTLDLGAEELVADKFTILKDEIIATDDRTQAETRLLTLESERALTYPDFDEAIAEARREGTIRMLAKNAKTGAVAIIRKANGWTDLKTGAYRPRVAVVTPTDMERIGLKTLQESAWEPISENQARTLWEMTTAALPKIRRDQFAIVTGLIIPLWKILANENPTVYRVNLGKDRSVLGRFVKPDNIAMLRELVGLKQDGAIMFTLDTVIRMLEDGGCADLTEGAFVARKRFMDIDRWEVCQYPFLWLSALKGMGCLTEIQNGKTRCFLPNTVEKEGVLEEVFRRFGALR